MADVKKIATRDSYGNGLVELGKIHENIVVLDADLAGATKSGMFKKAFPERHFNCGIADQIWSVSEPDSRHGACSVCFHLCYVRWRGEPMSRYAIQSVTRI